MTVGYESFPLCRLGHRHKPGESQVTYHRIFLLVVATRFPDATALKSI